MTYQQTLAYLDSLINYEKKSNFDYKKSFKLERMKSFSHRFEDPHKGIKTIHISGTKGKGSVSSFINSILMEAGYKVGLYTSPHLFSFRERIRINGEPIGEDDVARLIDKMKPYVDMMDENGDRPTYFEVCTMMAFLYFKDENVDFMVLEVGMGGRLDSTNVVDSLVSVITPISYDHTKFLGSTLGDIAFEKCGIIKDNSVVISSPQESEAMDVIRRISRERNSKLYVVGKDLFFEALDTNLEWQSFRLLSRYREYPHLRIKLLGDFQFENATAAVAAVEELGYRGIFISSDAIKDGLEKARWPGRLEIVNKKPFIVVDGAQDVNSTSRLKKAVKALLRYKRLFLIFGAMQDKDIDGMCRILSDMADCVVTTKSKSERAASPSVIREKMLKCNKALDVIVTDSPALAIRKCKEKACEEDLILVTGSLYVVADAMEALKGDRLLFKEREILLKSSLSPFSCCPLFPVNEKF